MSASERFSARQQELINQLLLGSSQRQAAKTMGVGESTVRRWMADPGFQRRLEEAQAELFKQVVRQASTTAKAMLAVLARIASDETQPAMTRVAAAGRCLQHMASLAPKTLHHEGDLGEDVRIRYIIEGVNPEVFQ